MTEEHWAAGYGPIRHTDETRARVRALRRRLAARESTGDGLDVYELLQAADHLTCAAMWLVAHDTYACNVYTDGRRLDANDFKAKPEGHMGGALNMVPAYVGYLAANALTGHTRSWLMGQGHAVAAIDGVNLLVGNTSPAHAARYSVSDDGLTRYARDYYAYQVRADGQTDSPRGSHVNAHTAGGLAEGGYLGFAELQYVHMPLPGERLTVFLSDGAFEEQRGSDWAPRWWRARDCGLVAPFMIANGRRIDQRTTMSQQGGTDWFVRHLDLNGFDPILIDGRDPAAFAWAIVEMEARLEEAGAAAEVERAKYPVRLPYTVAVAPKGAGFFGEGTNLAHNLPLKGNPHLDPAAADHFNDSAARLFVPSPLLVAAADFFSRHASSGRPRERDHALAVRNPGAPRIPEPTFRPIARDDAKVSTKHSPMAAIDTGFLEVVEANPHLRPRVGNPDEMRSNRMQRTLDALKFRVTDPEPGIPESLDGAVITVLNEEAVAAAALANKGGINIVVTYEAFGTKMHGVFRQEITFAHHQAEVGHPPRWLSVPLILTSHLWENAKNEQSHQDPSMAEAMLGESSDVSRVLFVGDHNSAAAVMEAVYRTRGQIWTVVAPKSETADRFGAKEARLLLEHGGLRLGWAGHQADKARLLLIAVGAFQLEETLLASERLARAAINHAVVYLLEPGRFRAPRNPLEAAQLAPDSVQRALFPKSADRRLFVTHTRPEALLGVLAPLGTGQSTTALGYTAAGGTFDTKGLLFANRSSWADIVAAAARLLRYDVRRLLSEDERAAIERRRSPHGVIF